MVEGKEIRLSDIVDDLNNMATPDGIYGAVESVGACPTIESGPGRVVLTPVSHLNSDVFDLTPTPGRRANASAASAAT